MKTKIPLEEKLKAGLILLPILLLFAGIFLFLKFLKDEGLQSDIKIIVFFAKQIAYLGFAVIIIGIALLVYSIMSFIKKNQGEQKNVFLKFGNWKLRIILGIISIAIGTYLTFL